MASGLLPKSPVSSSLCDEVPQIFIPKSHLEPREFLISSAKRLLQQYRPIADKLLQCRECPLCAKSRHRATSFDRLNGYRSLAIHLIGFDKNSL
jgi:hypothetical protein